MPSTSGPNNALTDLLGIRVGQVTLDGPGWLTGVTVLVPPPRTVGGVAVRGAAPGTRETDLLDPRNLVDAVDAIVLSGGSAFGLAAADGVAQAVYAAGRGWPAGAKPDDRVPIVPAAILFDLGRGGTWLHHPGPDAGRSAYENAANGPVAEGNVGAGTGAVAGGLKGGVGTAGEQLTDGSTVAALVVCNAVGTPLSSDGRLLGAMHLGEDGPVPDAERVRAHLAQRAAEAAALRAATREQGAETKAQGDGKGVQGDGAEVRGDATGGQDAGTGRQGLGNSAPRPGTATTLAVVATDATLTKAGCAQLAGVAHDGFARALDPVHTSLDGDTVFALATGARPAPDLPGLLELQSAAARCVTRALVRGLQAATGVDRTGDGGIRVQAWSDLVG